MLITSRFSDNILVFPSSEKLKMDLLGSILNSMDKPPSISDKQRDLMKKQKEEFLRKQKSEKQKLDLFRAQIEVRIQQFLQGEKLQRDVLPTMDHVHRSIVHDVAEVAGVTAFSIGEEGVDRHIILFKRECAPSDDELSALRRGEEWDPEKAKELAQQRELERLEEEEALSKKPKHFVPNSNYKEKYEHLIGKESAKEAARATQTNKQYGFVPSENKKDIRSIEQTLADIQTKKRQKISHTPASEITKETDQ